MKQLQNNFTTLEQSKRLLELGVPADSADCYYEKSASLSGDWEYKPYIGECVAIKQNLFSYRNGYVIPCWSVGRLMEIAAICFDMEFIHFNNIYFIKQMMGKFEMYAENMDFSKLEE